MAYVITHHWVPNFGANLQAFGTMQALKARGVAARFVDFRPAELVEKYAQSVPLAQQRAHEAFVRTHLPLTRPVATQLEFESLCRDMPVDYYVTGSDAVFRVDPASARADLRFPNPSWLVGAQGPEGRRPVKAALAPSAMGTRFLDMPKEARHGMKAALEDMTRLSVRDSWTRDQIASIGCASSAEIVPDPVFLLHAEIAALRARTPEGRPYVVLGTQRRKDRRWIERFTRIADAAGYDTVALPSPEGVVDHGTTRTIPLPLDPFDWMAILAGSSGYVGGRFHPVVVSLIASAPVVALDLYHSNPLNRRRSKTWLLMRGFGLAHVCHGCHLHRFVTPERAWRQIERQRGRAALQATTVARLTGEITRYLDAVFGPVTSGTH